MQSAWQFIPPGKFCRQRNNPVRAGHYAVNRMPPATAHREPSTPIQSGPAVFRNHWPEYLMEAAALGTFMVSACSFGVLLEHPGSPIHQALLNTPFVRQMLMGAVMGGTAIAIFFSPWGQRSGAHMNPAVTLTFLTLRKISLWDAFFYVIFQFLGGIAGVGVAALLIGPALQHSAVNYVVTTPGPAGRVVAFAAEFVISALMMTVVLQVSNHRRLSRYTPFFAGALVMTFITFEAPWSGMSMNPARTVGSAWHAGEWTALWIYFTAPPAGMLLASMIYRLRHGAHGVFCAKFHHHNHQRCIFHCRFGELRAK
jgi:aquaporin Z